MLDESSVQMWFQKPFNSGPARLLDADIQGQDRGSVVQQIHGEWDSGLIVLLLELSNYDIFVLFIVNEELSKYTATSRLRRATSQKGD